MGYVPAVTDPNCVGSGPLVCCSSRRWQKYMYVVGIHLHYMAVATSMAWSICLLVAKVDFIPNSVNATWQWVETTGNYHSLCVFSWKTRPGLSPGLLHGQCPELCRVLLQLFRAVSTTAISIGRDSTQKNTDPNMQPVQTQLSIKQMKCTYCWHAICCGICLWLGLYGYIRVLHSDRDHPVFPDTSKTYNYMSAGLQTQQFLRRSGLLHPPHEDQHVRRLHA
jgi:hypothetical protein